MHCCIYIFSLALSACAQVGLGLSYALTITRTLSFGVRSSTTLENQFNSVERVQEFITLKQEVEQEVCNNAHNAFGILCLFPSIFSQDLCLVLLGHFAHGPRSYLSTSLLYRLVRTIQYCFVAPAPIGTFSTELLSSGIVSTDQVHKILAEVVS